MKKLHIVDRFALSSMIPAQGEYAPMKVWQNCKNKLDFTAEELLKYGIVVSQTGIQWGVWGEEDAIDEDGNERVMVNLMLRQDEPIDNPLSFAEMKICKFSQNLKRIQKAGQLLGIHINLFEAIVGPVPVDLEYLAALAEKEEEEADREDEVKVEEVAE